MGEKGDDAQGGYQCPRECEMDDYAAAIEMRSVKRENLYVCDLSESRVARCDFKRPTCSALSSEERALSRVSRDGHLAETSFR